MLRLGADLSVRQTSICTKVSVGSIQKLLKSAQALGLIWPQPTELDDGRLAARQADTTISPAISNLIGLMSIMRFNLGGTLTLLLDSGSSG